MTQKELHGIYHDLNFWKGFVKTDRFKHGWVGKHKTPELQQYVADFIKSVPHEGVADVGSGVVSILNGLVEAIPIDPLGELYQFVFDYKANKMPVPLAFPAEEMPIKGFDIVHCSNAIDHTQNPMLAYERMMFSVKSGGYLILQGFENEGTHEKWQGFHQHDIYVNAQTLCIKNQLGQMMIMDVDPTHLQFVEFEGKRWYIWIKQKP